MAATGDGEGLDIGASEIGQRLGLEVAPQVFDRVEFGGVGRKVALPPLHHIEEDFGLQAAMSLGAIPEQEQRSAKVAGEMPEEAEHRAGIEVRIDQQLKVQSQLAPVGTHAQRGDRGDLFALTTDMPEHRSLSAPAPSAAHHRQQEQPALIEENQPSVQLPGFFLSRGHCCLIQRWIPCSSRSKARPVGRCGVQPSERSTRPI